MITSLEESTYLYVPFFLEENICLLLKIFFSSDMFVPKKKGMGGFVVDKRNGSRQKKY